MNARTVDVADLGYDRDTLLRRTRAWRRTCWHDGDARHQDLDRAHAALLAARDGVIPLDVADVVVCWGGVTPNDDDTLCAADFDDYQGPASVVDGALARDAAVARARHQITALLDESGDST